MYRISRKKGNVSKTAVNWEISSKTTFLRAELVLKRSVNNLIKEYKIMEEKISKIIKTLVEQISLKEISTRDFVEEMKALYDGIDVEELRLKGCIIAKDENLKELNNLRNILVGYKIDFVIPAEEYREKEIKLKYEHLDWQTEKKYIEKENKNLKMILASLTAIKSVNSSAGNGTYRSENIDKPLLE